MIIKKFLEQVNRFPDNIAVKTVDRTLTYRELAHDSHRVAYELRENAANEVVALLFEHGPDWLVGIIAALEANTIYVPLDITYPRNRLLYMLEHSGASVILTNQKNLPLTETLVKQSAVEIRILTIDNLSQLPGEIPGDHMAREAKGERPAYILYTSGSSGKPKGVVQNHENIMYFIRHWTRRFSITENHRMTLLASFSHDGSVPDIFAALLQGAALYPYDIKERPNIRDLIDWLNQERINIWHSVPTFYRYFIRSLKEDDVFPHLQLIVLGGEEVRAHDVLSFKTHFPSAKFANIYGQTESTINSIWLYSPEESFRKVIIGEPIGDTEILLVDQSSGIVEEVGVGEIVIASDHVALEYWKDKENSQKVFTRHDELGRLYWTGDRGRLTVDGDIVFMGRKDLQVKIRGYRVETAEIETRLLNHPLIKEAVVAAKEDENADNYLCAYIVSDEPQSPAELREFLSRELPDFMIPQYFINMEKMPLTTTGKIDRKALPEPGLDTPQSTEYEAPRNEIEEQITNLWQEILGKEKIGIHSNFFDLGGHSLLIITLISRIHQDFQVKLQLKDVFDHPTVKALSRVVMESQQTMFLSIEPAEKKEYYTMSSAQKRLFVLQQSEPGSVAYHIPGVYIWEGYLDVERFEAAFQQLVARHETLRTSFCLVQGMSVQRIHQTVDFKITFNKCTESQVKERIKTFRKPFDLSQAPLLRVQLLQVEGEKYFILFDIHHIISDAYSMQILIREFTGLYEGKSPKPLTIQYKDFALWQNEFLNCQEYKDQEQYWLNTLENFQFTRLPVDKFHPGSSEKGGQESRLIDKTMVEKINHLAREYGITRFALMMSVFFIVLAREISQKDITIGIPSAHREHHHLKNIIGIFLNVLLIRGKVDANDSFLNHMLKMKQTIIAAMGNQDYPYEFLYAKIKENTHFKENELFTILFNYFPLDEEGEGRLTDTFKIMLHPTREVIPKYDATLYVQDVMHAIHLDLIYRKNIFNESRMTRLMENFMMVLKKVLANENLAIFAAFSEDTRETDDFDAEFAAYYEDDQLPGVDL